MSDEIEKPVPGAEFQVTAHESYPLEELREYVFDQTGLRAHFKFRFGPTRVTAAEDGRVGITCPIASIDDPFLNFHMQLPVPAEGFILYIGYFLDSDHSPEAQVA